MAEPRDRDAFDAHLAACPVCRPKSTRCAALRADLAHLGAARTERVGVGGEAPRSGPRLAAPRANRRHSAPAAVRSLPAWAQVAAAVVLFCGWPARRPRTSTCRYSNGSVSVRTGWLHERAAGGAGRAVRPTAPGRAVAQRARGARAAAARRDDAYREHRPRGHRRRRDPSVARVRSSAESEKRQQRELALRVAEVAREAQLQRQADLVRIDRSLGLIQSRTGIEVMRTQQQSEQPRAAGVAATVSRPQSGRA